MIWALCRRCKRRDSLEARSFDFRCRGASHRRRLVSPAESDALSPRRVMIVDDEKGIRDALKQLLEYEEIAVQACASGHEATRALSAVAVTGAPA